MSFEHQNIEGVLNITGLILLRIKVPDIKSFMHYKSIL